MRYWLVLLFFFILVRPISGQNHDVQHAHKNRLAFFTGTSLAPTMIEGQSDEFIFVPTYGIEYERKILPWMALGVMNEVELQNYVITTADGGEIKRDFVYVGAFIIVLKTPVPRLAFLFGPGYELSSHDNFTIFKVGFEYGINIGHDWDIAPEVTYDQISNLYNTITFGIAIGKKF